MLIVDFDVGSNTIGRTSRCHDALQPTMFHVEGFDTNNGQMMMTLTIHRRTGDLFHKSNLCSGNAKSKGCVGGYFETEVVSLFIGQK